MTQDGRPLKFLAIVLTGWVGARAIMLWPAAPGAVAREAIVPTAAAAPRSAAAIVAMTGAPRLSSWAATLPPTRIMTGIGTRPMSASPQAVLEPAPRDFTDPTPPERTPGIVAGLPRVVAPMADARCSRLFGSVWAVARGGGGPPGGVPGVQLGGSQAGVRLGYALTADRRLALVGRATSPLGRGMREAAVGIEWQPTRLPLRMIAEHRVALGAGRGGPTLAVVGGVGPLPLAAGFRLEAYAQGGVIARNGAEGFADGALRVARPVAVLGAVRLDLGAGTWGAAQRGATRLDVGPSLSAVVPVGPQPVRLSLDWRQRVAGNAAPGSGLVVTLGADF